MAVSEDWLPCATDIAVPPSVAHEFPELLDARVVDNRAESARRYDLSRARVTQILTLLQLAPEIQEHILNMPKSTGRSPFSERRLRPLTLFDQHQQLQAFADMGSRWRPSSPQRDDGCVPKIAVSIRHTGEDSESAFLGGLGHDGHHQAHPLAPEI